MPLHEFSHLFERYPAIISHMPDRFKSHQFILHMAQENQKLYIEAPRYHYRDSDELEAPYMLIHGILARPVRYLLSKRARNLNEFPELIKKMGTVTSKNIFGQVNACANWEKVAINK